MTHALKALTGADSVRSENMLAIPHYLILRLGHESYVVSHDHVLMRRDASRMLRLFARSRGNPTPLDHPRWDFFSSEHGFSADERERSCLYSLVNGDETRHQLALLATL